MSFWNKPQEAKGMSERKSQIWNVKGKAWGKRKINEHVEKRGVHPWWWWWLAFALSPRLASLDRDGWLFSRCNGSTMNWLQKETWGNALLTRFRIDFFIFLVDWVKLGLWHMLDMLDMLDRKCETITVAPIQMEMEDKYCSKWNTNTRKCSARNTVGPVEILGCKECSLEQLGLWQ